MLVFNSISGGNGIIQVIERRLGFNAGDISGNTARMKAFTSEVNLAANDIWSIIFMKSGKWQWDDNNHPPDHPTITTNLVASQRDYSFITDETGNRILDIHRVFVMLNNADNQFTEVHPVDAQSERGGTNGYWDGLDVAGAPYNYDKTGNTIFLDPVPNYAKTNGLKVYVNREGVYFTVDDTTQSPGFAGLFHEYLVYAPCYKYAIDNNLANVNGFLNEKTRLENAVGDYYGKRARDERSSLKANPIIYK